MLAHLSKSWEPIARKQIKDLSPESGLTVNKSKRGMVELRRRKQGQKAESVILPFQWKEGNWGNAYTRARNILVFLKQGHSLRAAADLAAGKAPKKAKDWKSIISSFKNQKINHGKSTSIETFNKQYLPPIEMAVELMGKRNPPTNPKDLIDICIKDWPAGSVTRKHRARALKQFLIHAVEREGISDIWMPPTDLSNHIGIANPKEVANQEGDPFDSDQQIINLINSLPVDSPFPKDVEASRKWVLALQLMAELGLRPVELEYLKIRKDPKTKELYWWCTYQKKAGGGTTQARQVFPLPLIDDEGNLQKWNLIERWQAGLIDLPSCRENKMGEACNTYLRRRKSWVSLREMMKKTQGINIVPYSFRHSYSLRAHIRGIDTGSVAMAMGHSLEAHLRAYPWASKATTASAFASAYKQLKTI